MLVKAKCRNCGKEANSDSFKLHYKFKMMVCPDCFSGRTEQLKKRTDPLKIEKHKPKGWDAEDEYLEKVSRMRKEENQAQFSRIQGTSKVMCKCAKCTYSFKYDPFKRQPTSCPNCDIDIPKVKSYHLL